VRAVAVVPTYNEAENIERLIAEVHAVIPEIHIVVVDNESPDGTGRIVAEKARHDDRLRLLPCPPERGFSKAYIAGFKDTVKRGYDAIVQMDCDLSHQPRYLREFLSHISHYDAIIGSRYTPGGRTEDWPLHRFLVSRGGNAYARKILGVPLNDLTGGYKCWRRSALEAIDLDAVSANGFAFQMEMNYRGWQKGLRFKEVPIVFPNRTAGESKMMVREFWESIALPWRLRRMKL